MVSYNNSFSVKCKRPKQSSWSGPYYGWLAEVMWKTLLCTCWKTRTSIYSTHNFCHFSVAYTETRSSLGKLYSILYDLERSDIPPFVLQKSFPLSEKVIIHYKEYLESNLICFIPCYVVGKATKGLLGRQNYSSQGKCKQWGDFKR